MSAIDNCIRTNIVFSDKTVTLEKRIEALKGDKNYIPVLNFLERDITKEEGDFDENYKSFQREYRRLSIIFHPDRCHFEKTLCDLIMSLLSNKKELIYCIKTAKEEEEIKRVEEEIKRVEKERKKREKERKTQFKNERKDRIESKTKRRELLKEQGSSALRLAQQNLANLLKKKEEREKQREIEKEQEKIEQEQRAEKDKIAQRLQEDVRNQRIQREQEQREQEQRAQGNKIAKIQQERQELEDSEDSEEVWTQKPKEQENLDYQVFSGYSDQLSQEDLTRVNNFLSMTNKKKAEVRYGELLGYFNAHLMKEEWTQKLYDYIIKLLELKLTGRQINLIENQKNNETQTPIISSFETFNEGGGSLSIKKIKNKTKKTKNKRIIINNRKNRKTRRK
jgi:hypothetical protein